MLNLNTWVNVPRMLYTANNNNMTTEEKVLDKLERIRKNTSTIVWFIAIPWVIGTTLFVVELLTKILVPNV